jgi:hydrogenase-4 membrane subunit HyfE
MEWAAIVDFLYEIAYFLVVFSIFLVVAIFKGRQAIINVALGLYLALLISIQFPYYDQLFAGIESSQGMSVMKLLFFGFVTLLSTHLFKQLMPDEFREERFESFLKKISLAVLATGLVMVFSFQVLPVTEFLSPGTPLQALFAPAEYFFWWLLLPLVVLYFI